MSKGLSKLQKDIVGLLDGSLKRMVYSPGDSLTTRELLEELIEHDEMSSDTNHKVAMFTVRRACLSLLSRDIIKGEYGIDCDYPWAKIASWTIIEKRQKG
ncbi:MAG: hypothetical protein ABSE63_09360 [Thermoguttaceae bacterium]|jgi:hypothetical protein